MNLANASKTFLALSVTLSKTCPMDCCKLSLERSVEEVRVGKMEAGRRWDSVDECEVSTV